ncbi:DUF2652 domain-containing protein [Aquimarina sp. 2201CG5-10]|uniref:DUF2652 domain-containing protein n=1 Tax=Aquimarina callyspongiae TaxID=3098150 RepID=UPI002AB384DD|nr:DUF2652 domain-containing protein [Aquimarina sp. 2201CG5-10]MDY8134531.1 DUF2652 domain-containing protein [Aquimarina sp. 2201CG5-10]
MPKSLLFIPDISGFTQFVQNTEVEHSQHVISELLEVLIKANTQNLRLAEVEGDALFFFKENEIPSQEKLLAQIETMFTAFYSHLKLLEKNRVCPCNACATAPNLQLKIIAHCGELQFITVQEKRKPFGESVIQAHRLLKNSISSDNYALLSEDLSQIIGLPEKYQSVLYDFSKSGDVYDEKEILYRYSKIDNNKLKLRPFATPENVVFNCDPSVVVEKEFDVSATKLMEYITNYSYRHLWAKGVDKLEYNPEEITRLGSEHVCVIDGKRLNFTTVTKEVEPGYLIYGELTKDVPIDALYQFFVFIPVSQNTCRLRVELYPKAKSIFNKILLALIMKKNFRKSLNSSLEELKTYVEKDSD